MIRKTKSGKYEVWVYDPALGKKQYIGTYKRRGAVTEPQTARWAERIAKLAEHLGMSPRWVAYQVKAGMPSQCFGRARRFSLSEVESWLQRQAG